jgi:hypothetical protein
MPPVYAIISFFSYRFFRKYTYYALIEVAYESVTLSAFLSVPAFSDLPHRAAAEYRPPASSSSSTWRPRRAATMPGMR